MARCYEADEDVDELVWWRKGIKRMEILFEIILELIIEGSIEASIEASKSRKVPKAIRCLLILLISSLFLSMLGLIFFVGISSLKKTTIGGFAILLLGVVLLIVGIIKFKKVYLDKTK